MRSNSKSSSWLGVLLFFGGATLAGAWQMPAGPGLDALNRNCTQCHGVESVQGMRLPRAGWVKIIQSMRDMGAEVSAADEGVIANYLTANFGPPPAGSGAAGAAPGGQPEVRKPLRAVPWEKNPMLLGQALYRDNCVVCHDLERDATKKLGPSFVRLFKKGTMPKSGVPVTREYIANRVRFGGTVMPAFGSKLSPAEIDRLIDYMDSK